MKAWLTREPWRQDYELRIAHQAGRVTSYAAGVTEFGIDWKQVEDNTEVPVLMRLQDDVVEALAKALGEITQASDATVEALADTRKVRDRLLALIEAGWENP